MPSDVKLLNEWLRLARRTPGFAVERTKNCWLVIGPTGDRYYCPKTPGRHRSMNNTRAGLRRLGLPL